MNPFKPSQTLEEIQADLLPKVKAIAYAYGVEGDVTIDQKYKLIMVWEFKPEYQPLLFSVNRDQLEDSIYMGQFPVQVAGLAQIVVEQKQPGKAQTAQNRRPDQPVPPPPMSAVVAAAINAKPGS